MLRPASSPPQEPCLSILVELPEDTYRDRLSEQFIVSASFSFATARAMAWLAQLAYEQEPKIRAVLGQWGLVWKASLVGSASGLLTRGFVAEGWGVTIVAFAGTDPMVLANWLTNFKLRSTPNDLHAGFDSAARVIWPGLQSALQAKPSGRLFFTGHSLGAAIAVLAAMRVVALARVEGVYTLGMPRCGGEIFAEAYDTVLGERTYRLVNGHDVVPTVPPSALGFRHVGRSLLCPHGEAFDLSAEPSATPSDQPDFSESFVAGIRSALRSLVRGQRPPQAQPGRLGKFYTLLPPGIGDHLPARYLRALGVSLDVAAG